MKKRYFIYVAVVAAAVLVVLTVVFMSQRSPKAEDLFVPTQDSIRAIFVWESEASGEPYAVTKEGYSDVLSLLDSAKPTRRPSINDEPTTIPYYTIEIYSSEKSIHFYLCEEKGNVYIEIPYQGIYSVRKNAIDIIGELEYYR